MNTNRKGKNNMHQIEHIQLGQRPFGAIYRKITEIIRYLAQTKLIAGNGIQLHETAAGIVLEANVRSSVSGGGSRSAGETEAAGYSGPFELYIQGTKIRCRGKGCLNRNGEYYLIPTDSLYMNLPSSTTDIWLKSKLKSNGSWEKPTLYAGRIGTGTGYTAPQEGYFLLGSYDADKKKIKQYHFSPVVTMLYTGELY